MRKGRILKVTQQGTARPGAESDICDCLVYCIQHSAISMNMPIVCVLVFGTKICFKSCPNFWIILQYSRRGKLCERHIFKMQVVERKRSCLTSIC